MIIGHYAASIIGHHHASKMATIFLGCMLGESHIASLSHPDINILIMTTKQLLRSAWCTQYVYSLLNYQ